MKASARLSPDSNTLLQETLQAVADLIDHETAAIMIEPIQGEGGVQIPADGYLAGLRKIADENNCLLIFDEVQTCMARTGTWFGYQQWDVQPDILTMAKGIASGVACGAVITTNELAPDLRPGMHASTFGGNPLAMARRHRHRSDDRRRKPSRQRGGDVRTIPKSLRIAGRRTFDHLRNPNARNDDRRRADHSLNAGRRKIVWRRACLSTRRRETVIRLLPAVNISAEEVDEGFGHHRRRAPRDGQRGWLEPTSPLSNS